MDNVRVIFASMPATIKGYTIVKDDYFTIVLNSALSRDQNIKSYQHEMDHIQHGDFEKKCSADLIELCTHKK